MATPREIMQASQALNQAWSDLTEAQDKRDRLQATVDEKQAELTAAKAAVAEKRAVWDAALTNLKAIA